MPHAEKNPLDRFCYTGLDATTEWRLARISGTHLGFEDHGALTFMLMLEYADPGQKIGSSGQGFGHYILGTSYTDAILRSILTSVGVGSWEALGGRWVWADSTNEKVKRIMGVDTAVICDPAWVAEIIKDGGISAYGE